MISVKLVNLQTIYQFLEMCSKELFGQFDLAAVYNDVGDSLYSSDQRCNPS